jgi:hypothetical protein
MTNEDLIIKHKAESIIAKYIDIVKDRKMAIECSIRYVNSLIVYPDNIDAEQIASALIGVDIPKLKNRLERLLSETTK